MVKSSSSSSKVQARYHVGVASPLHDWNSGEGKAAAYLALLGEDAKSVMDQMWLKMWRLSDFKESNAHWPPALMKSLEEVITSPLKRGAVQDFFITKLKPMQSLPMFCPLASSSSLYSQVEIPGTTRRRVTAHLMAWVYRVRFLEPAESRLDVRTLKRMMSETGELIIIIIVYYKIYNTSDYIPDITFSKYCRHVVSTSVVHACRDAPKPSQSCGGQLPWVHP